MKIIQSQDNTTVLLKDNQAADAAGQDSLTITGAFSSIGSGPGIKFTEIIGGSDAAGIRAYTFGGSASGLAFSSGFGGNYADNMFLDHNGNVGIGTSTPSGKLHVQDPSTSIDTFITLKASGVRSAFMYYDRGATNAVSYSIYRTAGVDKWRTGLRPNSTDDFQIIRGASNTDVAMSISDNAAKLISGDFNDTSDVSLKNTIANHNYGVSKINEIQARSFKWNSDNRDAIGFIAQEVESVLPEAVSGEEGRKTIKVASILSVAVKAIQELSAELDAAKARIDTLESV